MANIDRPNGFTPVGTLDGSPWTSKIKVYRTDGSTNSTEIFRGDVVTLADAGYISAAAAGNPILGVVVGVKPDLAVAATIHPGYLPASTVGDVYVVVGSDVIFEVQEDNASNDIALSNVGSVGDHVATAGNTITGVSAFELDSSDVVAKDASPASAGFLVLGLVDRPDNAVGTYAKWLVKINEYQFATGYTGL